MSVEHLTKEDYLNSEIPKSQSLEHKVRKISFSTTQVMEDHLSLLQNVQDNYFEFEKSDERKVSEPSVQIFGNFSPQLKPRTNNFRVNSCTSGITKSEISNDEKEGMPFSLKLNEVDYEEQKDTIQELKNYNKNDCQLQSKVSEFYVSQEPENGNSNHTPMSPIKIDVRPYSFSQSLRVNTQRQCSIRQCFEFEEMENRIVNFLKEEGVEIIPADEYFKTKFSPFRNMKKISEMRLDLNKSPLRRNRANTICL